MSVISKFMTIAAAGAGAESYWIWQFGNTGTPDGYAYLSNVATAGMSVSEDQSSIVLMSAPEPAAFNPDASAVNRGLILFGVDGDGNQNWSSGKVDYATDYPVTIRHLSNSVAFICGRYNYYGDFNMTTVNASSGSQVSKWGVAASSTYPRHSQAWVDGTDVYFVWNGFDASFNKSTACVSKYSFNASTGVLTRVWEKSYKWSGQTADKYAVGVVVISGFVYFVWRDLTDTVHISKLNTSDGSEVSEAKIGSPLHLTLDVSVCDGDLLFLTSSNQLHRYTVSGAFVWAVSFSYTNINRSTKVFVDPATNDIFVGIHGVAGAGGGNAAIVKLNSAGQLQWSRFINNNLSKGSTTQDIKIVGDNMYVVVISGCASGSVADGIPYFLKLPKDGSLTGTYGAEGLSYSVGNVAVSTTGAAGSGSTEAYAINNIGLNENPTGSNIGGGTVLDSYGFYSEV